MVGARYGAGQTLRCSTMMARFAPAGQSRSTFQLPGIGPIGSCFEEWAYIRDWHSDSERSAYYEHFIHFYNHHRAHGALGWSTPIAILRDNVPASTTFVRPPRSYVGRWSTRKRSNRLRSIESGG
jgi:hypothetical protein